MTLAANSIEGKAKALADRIENLQIQIEDEQEACREACAPFREDIAEIWKEAKGGSLPVKAMRAYVRVRTAQRKAVAKLEPDERAAYENLREALGPLGEAAAERAGYPVDDQDLRPEFLKDKTAFQQSVDRAFSEGKMQSAAKMPAKTAYDPETPQYRAYMDGYAEHQTTLAAQA